MTYGEYLEVVQIPTRQIICLNTVKYESKKTSTTGIRAMLRYIMSAFIPRIVTMIVVLFHGFDLSDIKHPIPRKSEVVLHSTQYFFGVMTV